MSLLLLHHAIEPLRMAGDPGIVQKQQAIIYAEAIRHEGPLGQIGTDERFEVRHVLKGQRGSIHIAGANADASVSQPLQPQEALGHSHRQSCIAGNGGPNALLTTRLYLPVSSRPTPESNIEWARAPAQGSASFRQK